MTMSSLGEAPPSSADRARDLGLLILRVSSGGTMLLGHGMGKLTTFSERAASFPDPIGIGSTASLSLAVFGEVVCALLVALGLGTRLAAVPAAITMLVAAFVIHGADPFAKKELALLYAAPFVTLILTGGGRFSLDHLLFSRRGKGSLKLDV